MPNTTAPSEEDSLLTSLKRCALPAVFVCGMTAAIVFGVHDMVQRAVDASVRAKAERDARHWASHVQDGFGDPATLLQTSTLSKAQQDLIDIAIAHGNVFSFVLFDAGGRLVYSSDYGVSDTGAEQVQHPIAASVIRSQETQIDIIKRPRADGSHNLFVHAFTPIGDQGGQPRGAIGLYIDKSADAALYTKFMYLIGVVLPLICALLYALPALAFIMKREQAFARTRRVAALSRHDHLTGALNRQTLSREAQAHFANRPAGQSVGVFFLDVDNFKTINDENGHAFGDAYLNHLASILMGSVRAGDLVGRMGGDEFVIVLPNANTDVMEAVGQAILDQAREPFEHKGRTIQSSVSIGYHLADTSVTAPEALQAADLALYHAKATGRNKVVAYFPALDTQKIRRKKIEMRLREALEHSEFEIAFQPITSPVEGRILGFEGLVRLSFEDGTPLGPDEFIPIAEDCGLVQRIGEHVLTHAVETAKGWPADVFVSVNLSPSQFDRANVAEMVERLLTRLDFPAHRLELEVTEGLLLGNKEHVSDQLAQLKRLGVRIAMDDFGTGYSSLGYLWKYEFDKLKIDKVFMEGLDFDKDRYREVIETIIVLGHKMGMTVVVEGVETPGQIELLSELDCDQYQGFLFGRPMSAAETGQALAKQKRDTPQSA